MRLCLTPRPARRSSIAVAAILASGLLMTACTVVEEPEYVERPVAELYNEAMDLLQGSQYSLATQRFDEVERQHPYSVWATKAQLMAAYSYYQSNRYDDSIIALDRFIQLHPSNRDIAYAYYLKGLSYYEQISDVSRDQKMTELALQSLNEVVTRFPSSKFARDSKLKIDLTYDHLAGKEMEIGRYYQRKGHYLSAINRFKNVVDNYQTTTHVPEALHRLAESYTALGILDEARKVAAVLGHNFPGSEWYTDSFGMIEGKPAGGDTATGDAWYKFW